MKIHTLIFSPFQVNTYIFADEISGECAVIDPACYFPEEKKHLAKYLESNKLTPVKLLNTHGHLDHVFGNNFITDTYGLKAEHSAEDVALIASAPEAALRFGLTMEKPYGDGTILSETDIIKIGKHELKILHTPGHTLGSLVFYSEAGKVAFVGDVIFNGSIGRTDLPGGNHEQLLNSIKEKIYTLPHETRLYPGHGNATTVTHEMKTNPFVRK